MCRNIFYSSVIKINLAMLAVAVIMGLLIVSVLNAEILDPPTFYYELNSFPATTNELVSSNILSASGMHAMHLTEAPGVQADWQVVWYLDDKSTAFRTSDFTNQSATSDVRSSTAVLSNWARVYCNPAVTGNISAVVYGSWGSEY